MGSFNELNSEIKISSKLKLSSLALEVIARGFILYIFSFNLTKLKLCSRRVDKTGVKVNFCGVLSILTEVGTTFNLGVYSSEFSFSFTENVKVYSSALILFSQFRPM